MFAIINVVVEYENTKIQIQNLDVLKKIRHIIQENKAVQHNILFWKKQSSHWYLLQLEFWSNKTN